MIKNEVAEPIASPEMKRAAAQRAQDRARVAMWDPNMVIFLFAVLSLIIILTSYTKVGANVVVPIAAFGLGAVWLEAWRRGRQLYNRFYREELRQSGREKKSR